MNHERLELKLKEHSNAFTVQVEKDFIYQMDEVTETRLEALERLFVWLNREINKERAKITENAL